ncbi:bifunctional methylenetetrahydrofolate dehydrogenase/methenyltetrahydrofolate cyclohydrolase FolD [bacterium]|nr:bifunctional methylenetetrahydrofolate dehydrogenase/methenyltetrahydrofolate cyclohydrolase FolD [bacterium]
MAGIIDGKRLADSIRQEIAASVNEFYKTYGERPCLAALLVGEDPASQVYVRNKVRACEQIGIRSESYHLSASATEAELLDRIEHLNSSNNVDGILLQLPLPASISKMKALDTISPAKDVDGLHPINVGLLVQGRAELIACTPSGVIEALRRSQVSMTGKSAVVVGRSDLVGKPLALLLMQENATVTVCHSRTQNLQHVVSSGDIVIAAMGKPAFLGPDFIKEGAIVVDVGTTVLKEESEVSRIFGTSSRKWEDFQQGKTVLAGDVHPAAYERASMYTPVPGGVGPLTITMLLKNTLRAAQLRRR